MSAKSETDNRVTNFFYRYRYQIMIFVSIVIIKSIFNCFLSTLVQISGADEFGTIAGASYFAGLDWSDVVSHVSYYGFGYSMFMAPIFWITDNPVIIFQFMIAFNTICLAVSGIIAYNIIKGIFKVENETYAALAAFASAMYFGSVLNANAVYNESMLVLIGWIMVYILLKMQEKRDEDKSTFGLTIVLSLIMVYSLLVHTRALYLWGAAVIFMFVYLIVKRKLLANPVVIGVICAAGYLMSKFVIEKVQASLWLVGEDKSGLNNSVESLGGYFGNIHYLFTINGLKGFIYTIFGQIYGMITISGGFFAIFIAIILFVICKILYRFIKRESIHVNEKLLTLGMFIVSFLGAALILTALGISDRTAESVALREGSKWYLYARYWGMVGGLMIMFTLVYLYDKFNTIKYSGYEYRQQRNEKRTILIIAFIGFLIITLPFVWRLAPKFDIFECSYSNVYLHYVPMAFLKKGDYMTQGAFIIMSVFAMISLILLIAFILNNKLTAAVLAVIVLSLYNYGYATIVMDKDSSDRFYNEFTDIRKEIDELDLEKEQQIYVNVENTKTYNDKAAYIYDAQFWLNRYRVIIGTPDLSTPSVVITSKNTEEYLKAGFDIVYVKDDSEIYETITVLQKKQYSNVPNGINSSGEIGNHTGGEVSDHSNGEIR